MTLTATWLQSVAYAAQRDRTIVNASFDEGILNGFRWSVDGVARQVTLAIGRACIDGDDAGNTGTSYLVTSDAIEIVAIPAAPGSGTQIHTIVLRVDDTTAGGPAGNTPRLSVISGTVGGGAPATPTTAIPIVNVSMTAGQTAVASGQVTERRVWSGRKENVGVIKQFHGPASKIPVKWVELTGQTIGTVAAYPDLADLLDLSSGSITLPDARDRVLMSLGVNATSDTSGEQGGSATATLALTNLAAHSHTVNGHTHTGLTGIQTANHTHTTDTAANHQHPDYNQGNSWLLNRNDPGIGGGWKLQVGDTTASTGDGGAHSHATGNQSANHQHAIPSDSPGTDSQGSGTPFSIVQPFITFRTIMRVLA